MNDSQATRVSLLLRLQSPADRQAWSDFVDIYSPILYGFGRRHGLQDVDATDLVQDVLLSVSKSIRCYDRQRGPLTFRFLSRLENPRHLGRMGLPGPTRIPSRDPTQFC